MAINRFTVGPLKLILIGLVSLFISGAGLFSENSEELATDKNVKNTKPLAKIEGFRSAKFNMSMDQVKEAIYQDFRLSDEKIDSIKDPTEQTYSLAVTVEKLLPTFGKSRVMYVFDYKTKRLSQVNILMGHPVDTESKPEQIVDSGNLLGNHFFKKQYQEDGLLRHARLSDGSVLIFRGKDQTGRMALLRLSNPQPNAKKGDDLKISLTLSYINTISKCNSDCR
ncbi:MAG TPA: hypothetical protein HPP54_03365 [Nitrospinae bacterium]|jgi:hypothetical protein|nr:hypothetical protein [Nitrospinota bacterium]